MQCNTSGYKVYFLLSNPFENLPDSIHCNFCPELSFTFISAKSTLRKLSGVIECHYTYPMCHYSVLAAYLLNLIRTLFYIAVSLPSVFTRTVKSNMTTFSPWNRESDDEDDLLCEYDSTWEDETDCDFEAESSQRNTRHTWRRNLRAAMDMQTYRRGYPDNRKSPSDMDQEEPMANLQFYRNEIPSLPENVYISQFHMDWKGDYARLEWVHSYIQWLFPLQESGMNYLANVLTKKEIEEFCEDEEAQKRLVISYELMLDFYGIRLVDKSSGKVERSEKWEERFENLNRNTHNSLRITRILKCLGELGFKHYQEPLVKFFLDETLIKNQLPHLKQSVMDYFLFSVRDKKKRKNLIEHAFRYYKPKDKFVWCPKKIQRRLLKAQKTLDNQDLEMGSPLDESGSDWENETNLTQDNPDTSKAFQSLQSSVDPLLNLNDQDRGKGDLFSESGSNQENKTDLDEDSPDNFRCQGSSVDPPLERSVEQSPPVNRKIDQPRFPDSVTPNAQEEETGAKTGCSRVPAETQSNNQDIEINGKIDDTPAAEQESALEMQIKKEVVGMAKNPSDNCPEEIHEPAGKKDGLSDRCNPAQNGGGTGKIDPQLSMISESPTDVGGVEESLNCLGADTESKTLLSERTECHEMTGTAENSNRPKGVIEIPQPWAKGVQISKAEGGEVERSEPKGGVEDAVSLDGTLELHRSEDAAPVNHPPEGDVSESPKPDTGADMVQRPEGAVEDDAGDVLSNPDETGDDAMICVDSPPTPGGDKEADGDPMEIDSAQNPSAETEMEQ
ncbi:hypothetical protein COCON_G00179280 [Conger conger]|uniref:Opioid growth factor receptor (OGFr) conserved domain-containing protein n=1 Tax=Conger conger TaxID=82655 RepID=A0A9Q1D598_CONCO|nr:hypothetical protein COCON_G00179280 [Conger conger]